MKLHCVLVRGVFHDIYSLGQGFYTKEKAETWDKALDEIDDIFWKRFKDTPYSWGTDYLVSTGGSIFLHPTDFNAILHSCGNSTDSFNCKALKEVCEEIAKKCGGSFDLYVSKPFEVEADLVPYVEGIHNTLGV